MSTSNDGYNEAKQFMTRLLESELPKCIKKRVRWVQCECMTGRGGLTFIDFQKIALPNTEKEKELKDEYRSYWLPIDDDYKDFWRQLNKQAEVSTLGLVSTIKSIIEMAVPMALIYGLNDEEELKNMER